MGSLHGFISLSYSYLFIKKEVNQIERFLSIFFRSFFEETIQLSSAFNLNIEQLDLFTQSVSVDP